VGITANFILSDVLEPTPSTQLVATDASSPTSNIIRLEIYENGTPVGAINVSAEDLAELGRAVPLLLS